MIKKNIKVFFCLLACVVFVQCSALDVSKDTYSGPGSFYTLKLKSNNRFNITIADNFGEEIHTEISGRYKTLSTGFLKMRVTKVDSTDPSAPEEDDVFFSLLVDGMAMFVRPVNATQVIPMILTGECPAADFTANWFLAQDNDLDKGYTSLGKEVAGQFNFDFETQTLSLDETVYAGDHSTTSNEFAVDIDANCEDGFVQTVFPEEVEVDSQLNVWMTANGGSIVQIIEEGLPYISLMALPQQTMTSISDFAGDYAALLFVEDAEENIKPMSVTINSDGVGTANVLDDVEEGTVTGDTATITLNGDINSPLPGMVTGTVSQGADSGSMICSTNITNEKHILLCVGQEPADNTNPFTVIMVENLE